MWANTKYGYAIRSTLFSAGYILGPFTLWNDAFINAPLTLIFAEPLVQFFDFNRALTYAWVYGATNVLGLAMMAAAALPNKKP